MLMANHQQKKRAVQHALINNVSNERYLPMLNIFINRRIAPLLPAGNCLLNESGV